MTSRITDYTFQHPGEIFDCMMLALPSNTRLPEQSLQTSIIDTPAINICFSKQLFQNPPHRKNSEKAWIIQVLWYYGMYLVCSNVLVAVKCQNNIRMDANTYVCLLLTVHPGTQLIHNHVKEHVIHQNKRLSSVAPWSSFGVSESYIPTVPVSCYAAWHCKSLCVLTSFCQRQLFCSLCCISSSVALDQMGQPQLITCINELP